MRMQHRLSILSVAWGLGGCGAAEDALVLNDWEAQEMGGRETGSDPEPVSAKKGKPGEGGGLAARELPQESKPTMPNALPGPGAPRVAECDEPARVGGPFLAELAAVCRGAGGSWSAEGCACEAVVREGVEVPQVFSPAEAGACGDARLTAGFTSCARLGFEHVLKQEGPAALRACLGVGVARRGGTSLVVEGAPDELLTELAVWLDARTERGQLPARLPSDVGSRQEVVLQFAQPDSDRFSDRLGDLPLPMPGSAFGVLKISRPLFVDSVGDLDEVLGLAGAQEPATVPPEQVALQRLLSASARAPFAGAGEYEEQPAVEGCLGACDVKAHRTVELGGSAYSTTRGRRYQGGTLMEERFELKTADDNYLLGWILYDLAGQPNLLATLEAGATVFETQVVLYDRQLREIGKQEYDALAAGQVALLEPIVARASALAPQEVGVVVCESDFGGPLAPELAQALLPGPHAGAPGEEGKSFFGWRQAAANDVRGYLDGVIETRFSVPLVDDGFSFGHATDTSELALGGTPGGASFSGIRIVPVDRSSCILKPEVLQEVAAADQGNQVRVLSLSALYPIDQAACDELLPKGPLDHFLWVAGSGNEGRFFRDLGSAHNCPQSSAFRQNLIVVDGAIGQERSDQSDTGPFYADIAADCGLRAVACLGTSVSAPRVAHVAARIVAEQREAISNEMVRAAILLSASIPESTLSNRTGGIVSSADALGMADAIVAQGWGHRLRLTEAEVQSLLQEFYEGGMRAGVPLADFKLELLTARGFFEAAP